MRRGRFRILPGPCRVGICEKGQRMLYNGYRRKYASADGPVRHLDGSSLSRPLDLPQKDRLIMLAFVLAAAVIGGIFLFDFLGTDASEEASVEETLARDVSYDLPQLTSLIALDNDSIRQTFTDAGYTIYDSTDSEESETNGMSLVKLPSDVTETEAVLLYSQGVANLSASDAAKLLNGSWTFTVDRTDSIDMSVHDTDFSSESVEAAVQAAVTSEGLDASTLGESGTDDSGNTYQAGTVEVGGTTYAWRGSAIELSAVYDISGLPETAVYVGIRLTAI